MKIKSILTAIVCLTYSIAGYTQKAKTDDVVIIADTAIIAAYKPAYKEDKTKFKTLYIMAFSEESPEEHTDTVNAIASGNKYIWSFNVSKASKTLNVYNPVLFSTVFLVVPGDSIHITSQDGKWWQFSGTGANKYQLIYDIERKRDSLKFPVAGITKRGGRRAITVNEYAQISNYYNDQLAYVMPLIDLYKSKISGYEYDWMKLHTVQNIEKDRYSYFSRVPIDPTPFKFNYTLKDKEKVWDTTMYGHWAKWLRNEQKLQDLNTSYFYFFSRQEIWRQHDYRGAEDTLASTPMRIKLYYDHLLKNYKGVILEKALCYLLEDKIHDLGAFNPVAQALLKDYYARSIYPGYKKWVKALEDESQFFSSKNSGAAFFTLQDTKGHTVTERILKNKFAIINFWYSGCEKCKLNVPVLNYLQQQFKNDTGVVFLNISVDKDNKTWLKNIQEGIYTSTGGIHLSTAGLGKAHAIIKDYNVTEFPSLRYINKEMNMEVLASDIDPAKDNGKALVGFLNAKLPANEDGPYVIYENGNKKSYYISNENVTEKKAMANLSCATDQRNRLLNFSLQKSITPPPVEYAAPEKVLVVSDIEGNFEAFRKLLQSFSVIDENFNWTFNKGHLVLNGDFFDRGEQVTEVLWLIYSLEEKAKQAGGFVHFILGNHEIMNLQGNLRYVRIKYIKNAQLLGENYATGLYGENSELGKWVRSKNVVEKIGDMLFMHGGVSPELNRLNVSLIEINQLARPFYARFSRDYNDTKLNTIMSSSVGPFWYRGYYNTNPLATKDQIDSTLSIYNANYILTGHTVVSDTISVWHNGKVINTDTRHVEGRSEALLIENNTFFRVNAKGGRVLLFKDDKNALNRLNINSGTN
jgi:cytochrome oxidase Cu insertion factor (SCO1/SenC/PrrC family)